ncbi:MAG: branched-chain amino acid ABC transporter substrate-binding protein [Steroidobacteraceae bacterium]
MTAAALAGCFDSGDDDAPIRIAIEAPLTGEQASNGQDMKRGVELAVAAVNAGGGVLGRKIELIDADDQANPSIGEALVSQVSRRGVVAVIGPYNSSVGLVNLPLYTTYGIVPVHLTSDDGTSGYGVTVQPKNSQISPVEVAYISALAPAVVSMIVDPSSYTQGMADRLQSSLQAQGVRVIAVPITAGESDYTNAVRLALSATPQVIYVSTYYPEGALVAQSLASEAASGGGNPSCFMGLANQDPAFVTAAGIDVSRRCVFSGVPTPDQLPDATDYLARYNAAYPGVTPGVWGTFTYDSANLLFDAMERAATTQYSRVLKQLRATVNFAGATGPITIDPTTGNRPNVPVDILAVTATGDFAVVD